MKFLVLSLGKMIFQVSIIIFIIGYCFGFWFKGQNRPQDKTQKKLRSSSIQPIRKPANIQRSTQNEAA